MTPKKLLEFQIEHYTSLANNAKDAEKKDMYLNDVAAFKRRLKNIDKPLSPVSENYKLQAQFKGNFYSLN